MEAHLAIAGIDVPLQVLGDVLCQLEVYIPTAETSVFQRTLIISIVDRSIVLGMLCTATDAQVVVPSVRTAEQVVLIVVGTHVAVFLQVVAVLAAQTKILGNVGAILVTIRGGIAPVAQQ